MARARRFGYADGCLALLKILPYFFGLFVLSRGLVQASSIVPTTNYAQKGSKLIPAVPPDQSATRKSIEKSTTHINDAWNPNILTKQIRARGPDVITVGTVRQLTPYCRRGVGLGAAVLSASIFPWGELNHEAEFNCSKLIFWLDRGNIGMPWPPPQPPRLPSYLRALFLNPMPYILW